MLVAKHISNQTTEKRQKVAALFNAAALRGAGRTEQSLPAQDR
jgi:hypothetical protein